LTNKPDEQPATDKQQKVREKVELLCSSRNLFGSVGFEVLIAVILKSTIFWVKLCLPPALTLVSCSAYFSILKMEAICCSETSVDFQLTTRRYIPEDVTLLGSDCLTYYSTQKMQAGRSSETSVSSTGLHRVTFQKTTQEVM
jgi:hypothetical protein